jgi:hypothetical protein
MTVHLDFTPQVEARLAEFARQKGIDQAEAVKEIVIEHLPAEELQSGAHSRDTEDDASIALLKSWIASAPADPAAVQEAEEDLREFMRNINLSRKEAGARLIYPEAE